MQLIFFDKAGNCPHLFDIIHPQPRKNPMKKLAIICTALAIIMISAVLLINQLRPKPVISTITREGIVTEIQTLSRLQSVAFGVDTVITANKEGTWQKLWQDEQKGLFVARGRVLAGIDLSNITPEMVQLSFDEQTSPKVPPQANITITLPPAQVFEVFLDDIQVYDWQTGLFGVVDNDPAILAQAQVSAKDEVLKKACQGDVLNLAITNAAEQVKGLFMLTGATVTVNTQGAGACSFRG